MKLDVLQVVRAALDLPESERKEFVAKASGGDATLRQDIWHSLTEALAEEARLLLVDGDTDRPIKAESIGLQINTLIGVFRLIKPIGAGGMGQVWLAKREGEFQQQVAIKWLHANMSDAGRARFARERELLAKLEHPNIARIVDGGEWSGLPWFAMEYVDGEPLDRFAEIAKLDLNARLALLLQVCDAVHFAHQRLIVHRDLKPSNVLVASLGQVKLLDFGIAKLLDGSAIEAQRAITESRAPMTIAYAAPEQITGDVITTATDVYALGVMLYELLTGTRPHTARAGSSNSDQAMALMRQIADSEFVAPSKTLARQVDGLRKAFARSVRGDLDTITLKALSREPARRYASAGALADDVRRWLRGMPIDARPDSGFYRARKFVARHRFGSAALVLSVVCLIGGLSWALLASQREAKALRTAAQLAQANAQSRDFLVSLFGAAAPEQSLGKPLTAIELLDAGWARLQQESLQGETLTQTAMSMADSFYGLGEMPKALAAYQTALKSMGAETAAEERVKLILKIASVEAELVQFANARREVASALKQIRSEQNLASNFELQRRAHRLLGFIERDAANYLASIEALQTALKLTPMPKAERAGLLNSLAYTQAMQGDARAAIATFKATRDALSGTASNHPSLIWLDYTEGDAMRRLGLFDVAREKLDRAHQALIGASGQGQAIVRVVQMARAVLAIQSGKLLDDAVLRESGLSTKPNDRLNLVEIEAYLIYAEYLQKLGQTKAAMALHTSVQTQCFQTFTAQHPICRPSF